MHTSVPEALRLCTSAPEAFRLLFSCLSFRCVALALSMTNCRYLFVAMLLCLVLAGGSSSVHSALCCGGAVMPFFSCSICRCAALVLFMANCYSALFAALLCLALAGGSSSRPMVTLSSR